MPEYELTVNTSRGKCEKGSFVTLTSNCTMGKMNAAEFIRVFDDTRDGLFRLFRRHTKDDDLADDLVQECYLRLWEKREDIQDPSTYVFGIAFNIVKEFHRRRIQTVIRQLEVSPEMETYPEMQDTYSPDEQYYFKETRQIVREIIDALSPEKKAAFILVKEEERSYKEASEISGVPVSTLEKQVAGSVRILRKAFYLLIIINLRP